MLQNDLVTPTKVHSSMFSSNSLIGKAGRRLVGMRDGFRQKLAKFFLSRSQRIFDQIYDEYWSKIQPQRNLAPDPELYDRLMRDGYAIIPNFVTPQVLAKAQAEVAALEGFAEGQYKGTAGFTHLDSDGICTLQITDELPTCKKLIVESDYLLKLAKSLYGPEVRLSAAAVLNKFNKDRVDSSIAPHWDDWRVRFKAFIYLTDVDVENAPMIFIQGSHKRDLPVWRRDKDYASWLLPMASAGGSWWPVEKLGMKKVFCTGKAGSLVLFDAGGIHAGTQLVGSKRVMLMAMYTTHMPLVHRAY